MRVADHMSRDTQFLRTDDSCQEIIRRMDESTYPHFIVLDDRQRLAGVLTLTDFKNLFAHPDRCTPEATAGRLMVQDVVTVAEDSTMEKAFHQFVHHRVSFLPVVASWDHGIVVGQIRKADLFAAYEQHVIKKHILSPLGWVCPLPPPKGRQRDT
jgi:CIC family chloride channel protein